jgi:voltage-gated potassium channel
VVIPNLIGGLRMASQMVRPRVVRYLDTMLRDTEKIVRIEEIMVQPSSRLIDKSIASLDLASYGNLLLLAVVSRKSERPLYNPSGSYAICEGDTLVFQTEPDIARKFQEKNP